MYDIKWVIPTSWGVGLVCGLLWIWPFGPMAKQTLEKRKLAREQQQAATGVTAVDQEKLTDNDDYDEVIDPDEEYVPKPAVAKPVVSFHGTSNTEASEETPEDSKPKTFAGKLAAATFNQGEICICMKKFVIESFLPLHYHPQTSKSNPFTRANTQRNAGPT